MTPDQELVLVFGGLHLVALVLACCLFWMFLKSDTVKPWEPGDEEEDEGGGGGNDRLQRPPKPPRPGGVPLPDATPVAPALPRTRAPGRPPRLARAPSGPRAAAHARARLGGRLGSAPDAAPPGHHLRGLPVPGHLLLLARALVGAGNERADVLEALQAQARGDAAAVLELMPRCARSPTCARVTRERTAKLKRAGKVEILNYTPSVQAAFVDQTGTARVAWRTQVERSRSSSAWSSSARGR